MVFDEFRGMGVWQSVSARARGGLVDHACTCVGEACALYKPFQGCDVLGLVVLVAGIC